jgi:hypothetical protein
MIDEMGAKVDIADSDGDYVVSVVMRLSRQESSDLFLSGDFMITWPDEGLQSDGDPFLERTSMFVSEAASRADGFRLRYDTKDQAERVAYLLRKQLAVVGIGLEE